VGGIHFVPKPEDLNNNNHILWKHRQFSCIVGTKFRNQMVGTVKNRAFLLNDIEAPVIRTTKTNGLASFLRGFLSELPEF